MYLRISGVYSQELIQKLKEQSLCFFAFDLRPSSFNFIQAYKIVEFIDKTYQYGDRYILTFAEDKDYVVKGIVENLLSQSKHLNGEILGLEFTSARDILECNQMQIPFMYHYHPGMNLHELKAPEYLETLVLTQDILQVYERTNTIYQFLEDVFQWAQLQEVKVEAQMGWGDHSYHSILDFYPFAGISYNIDQKVEFSYRNVNLQLVHEQIQMTLKSLIF